MKKIAFTVVEILVCVTIIGILTVVTLNVSKNNSARQYAKLYYAAYNSLVQAVGNAYLEWNPTEDINYCLTGSETSFDETGDPSELKEIPYYWSKTCWKYYTGDFKIVDFDYDFTDDEHVLRYDEANTQWLFDKNIIFSKGVELLPDESHKYGGVKGYPRRYPGFLMGRQHDPLYTHGRYDGWGTNQAFCKDIVQYYNTISHKNECQSFLTGTQEGIDLEIAGDFHEIFCALQPPSKDDPEGEPGGCQNKDTGVLLPSFIASNGQKFYISIPLVANLPLLDSATGSKTERRYFRFIAVDINGDSKPNRQYASGAQFPWLTNSENSVDSGSYPDIVLFAITDNGQVIPVGLPEFTTTYATAKVYYPEYLNKKVIVDGMEQFQKNNTETSSTMDLYNAKLTAWGNPKAQASNLVCGQPVIDGNVLTYSSLFYWIALNCGQDGCVNQKEYPLCQSNLSEEDTPLYADPLMANLLRQFMFKEKGQKVVGSWNNVFLPTVANNSLLDKQHGCTSSNSKCKVQIEMEK